jgi:hypothetical protein
MKARWSKLILLLALLVSLFPAGTVFADDDGGYEFRGTIESLPATGLVGDWVVSGRTVHVTAATRIEQEHGPAVVGAYVEVKGWLQGDGSVNASKIEVKQSPGGGGGGRVKFYGTVESLPASGLIGDWRVSGRTVHVTAATRIEQKKGPAAVGAYVEVEGTQQADSSVNASKIEVKQSPGGGGGQVKFSGTVESLPNTPGWIGDWRVSGRTVHVTAATRIEQRRGQVAVGAYVEVKGTQQADGSVNASKIEVKRR